MTKTLRRAPDSGGGEDPPADVVRYAEILWTAGRALGLSDLTHGVSGAPGTASAVRPLRAGESSGGVGAPTPRRAGEGAEDAEAEANAVCGQAL